VESKYKSGLFYCSGCSGWYSKDEIRYSVNGKGLCPRCGRYLRTRPRHTWEMERRKMERRRLNSC